jgi:seryl-tRNA synthetase
MLDIRKIREEPAEIQRICDERGVNFDVSNLIALDQQRLNLQREIETLRAEGNKVAKSISSSDPQDRESLVQLGSEIKERIKTTEKLYLELAETFDELASGVPNLIAPDTPLGKDPDSNLALEVHGTIPVYKFKPRDHIELGKLHGLDLDAGARVAGAGFPLLRGNIAQLESALLRFVYDRAVNSGFEPASVPLLARVEVLKGLGFNPRKKDDSTEIFFTQHDNLALSGTAEIPLIGQYSGTIIPTERLPIKHVALTPCFRREGASGRRDAGLYRNRMFNKVELVAIVPAENSDQMLENIRQFETSVFQDLGLHFRLIRIAAGDLGAPAFKKYDIEGWMIGRGKDKESSGWGELTSCSDCTSFQARRLSIRHKDGKSKPEFVHTVNGTGITTRALIPLMEQNQTENGTILIPEVLRPYMGGQSELRPNIH